LGLGFRVLGFGFGDGGLEFRFRVEGKGFSAQAIGFKV